RPRSLRTHEAGPGPEGMEICPELCRCKNRRHRGNCRPLAVTSILKFSPDSRTLAFARASAEGQSICTTPLLGGEEKRIVTNAKPRFAWTSDSREILFADLKTLWKVSVRGGEPERLQFSKDGFQPSISGNRLVY